MKALQTLYKQTFGIEPASVVTLPGAGSNRVYVRFATADGQTCIGAWGKDVEENRTFLYLARHFSAKGLPVPRVLGVSADEQCYLLSDLGDVSLHGALAAWREQGYDEGSDLAEEGYALLQRTLRRLPHFQVEGAQGLDFERLLSPNCFCRRSVMFDLNYFKYCFLKTSDLPFDEMRLEDDFEALTEALVEGVDNETNFLYRDFQSRNVMVCGSEPFMIDFQGGRRGPLPYDVASFLWQASANYPQALRERLIEEYLAELATLRTVDREAFRQSLRRFVLFRLLQVLGAYGLRGRFERKAYFLQSIPLALANVRELLKQGVAQAYPTLEAILLQLSAQTIK